MLIGKTTLLDLISFRREQGEITGGDILVDGHSSYNPAVLSAYKHRLSYVEQLQGAYFEDLTVLENMMYAALLRLPSSLSIEEKMAKAAEALKMLNLLETVDTVVGDASSGSGGLSGGQKRKLAVAMELLHDPLVLAMDEPTSRL
jgi:ABC-type multidrug transport system ATPase subunit